MLTRRDRGRPGTIERFRNEPRTARDLAVKRHDLVRYLEEHGFFLFRDGKNHSIYTNDRKTILVKRHVTLDRITPKSCANRPV
jgi:mRNA interferase HicA